MNAAISTQAFWNWALLNEQCDSFSRFHQPWHQMFVLRYNNWGVTEMHDGYYYNLLPSFILLHRRNRRTVRSVDFSPLFWFNMHVSDSAILNGVECCWTKSINLSRSVNTQLLVGFITKVERCWKVLISLSPVPFIEEYSSGWIRSPQRIYEHFLTEGHILESTNHVLLC